MIEHAAAAGHPEGLYNLGVLHQNGMAGFDRDPMRAVEYFEAAANHPRPFNMALHALGNHYLYGISEASTIIVVLILCASNISCHYSGRSECYSSH